MLWVGVGGGVDGCGATPAGPQVSGLSRTAFKITMAGRESPSKFVLSQRNEPHRAAKIRIYRCVFFFIGVLTRAPVNPNRCVNTCTCKS